MQVMPVSKKCPVCETNFKVPPSRSEAICCSRRCADLYQARNRVPRVCQHCGKEYMGSPSKNKVFCSQECALTARPISARGRKRGPRIPKICPECGTGFEVVPSMAHVTYCSLLCHRKHMRGRPRNFTPESHARLTGRPRKSVDETRICPRCGDQFTVRSYDTKKFCSKSCYVESRRGVPNYKNMRRIEKRCPVCHEVFSVPPSQVHVVCCSRRCAAALKRHGSLQQIRQMTDAEVAWLAGIFDGEGSIILSQRKRSGTGYVRATITNTVLPLLERVIEVTGVGSITHVEKSKNNPRHQDSYTWHAGGAYSLELIRQMRPWLIAKAERADAVLAGNTFPRQLRWDNIYPPATA
jgi:hypothetical protein